MKESGCKKAFKRPGFFLDPWDVKKFEKGLLFSEFNFSTYRMYNIYLCNNINGNM